MNKLESLDLLEKRARKQFLSGNDADSFPARLINDEISIYQIELELQNADLMQAEHIRDCTNTKYQSLYNLSPIAYFSLDTQGIITEVNHAGMNIFKKNRDQLLNKCFSRFISSEYLMLFSGFLKNLLTKCEINNCELKLLSGYSSTCYFALSGVTTINSENEIEILLSIVDISKYKVQNPHYDETANIEKKFTRYEFNDINITKIAHELNNPLTVVLNYVNGCIKKIEDGNCTLTDLLKPLKEASKQSSRASDLISRLKNHQQHYDFDFKSANLLTLIHTVIELINFENPDFLFNITFRECPSPNLDLDHYLIKQVLINLFRNSVEALRDAQTPSPTIIVEINRSGKDFVTVVLYDNGPGIDSDISQSIFDLYFTTKPYGMGLGLPTSLSIIKAHGGNLSVRSHNVGTSCTFTLKIAQN